VLQLLLEASGSAYKIDTLQVWSVFQHFLQEAHIVRFSQ